jgi:Ni/Co efflux regulator RcnB
MKRILIAALTLGLAAATAAEAQPHRNKGRHNGDGSGRPEVGGVVPRGPAWRRGPANGWERGQTLPSPYLGGAVDYRSNGLRRPPSGYAWVQVGRNFLLTDTRTGMVLDVIPTR